MPTALTITTRKTTPSTIRSSDSRHGRPALQAGRPEPHVPEPAPAAQVGDRAHRGGACQVPLPPRNLQRASHVSLAIGRHPGTKDRVADRSLRPSRDCWQGQQAATADLSEGLIPHALPKYPRAPRAQGLAQKHVAASGQRRSRAPSPWAMTPGNDSAQRPRPCIIHEKLRVYPDSPVPAGSVFRLIDESGLVTFRPVSLPVRASRCRKFHDPRKVARCIRRKQAWETAPAHPAT